MHKIFNHKNIEKKWQDIWKSTGIYKTTENPNKPKTFVLDMFPYPSGEGLHVGHPKGYIATDIYSRLKRMTGHEVLHPMGWDAFGLPAENFAIKHHVHPNVAVKENIAHFKDQLSVLGFDYDWDREINTTDPEFYKWTQWIFIQLWKRGLAYESNEPINWCPECQTGLANEDLESDGTCERCDSVVEKRPMRQWVLKIREYADRMLEDLDALKWPEYIKEAQRNWIGRSEGAEIDFKFSTGDTVTVFTTRPDTLFGATYVVLAPEHPIVKSVCGLTPPVIENLNEIKLYIEEVATKDEISRTTKGREKSGVKLEGITAQNPASKEDIPVFIADYVLASYGTGAIMAVPAHDERDFDFATKFDIPIKQVIVPYFKASGDDSPQEGVETVERSTVDIIIEHPNNGTFLIQKEIAGDRNLIHFVGGGTDGEDDLTAVARELLEETGFSEFEFVSKKPVFTTRSIGYRHNKGKNQQGISNFYHIKLTGLNQVPSKSENGKHTIEWLNKNDVKKYITWSWHEKAWDAFNGDLVSTDLGILVHSNEFDSLASKEAGEAIVEKVGGRITSTYKIRDWVFSRQRYWGEPIPIVRAEDGTIHSIDEAQLPVILPDVEHYKPSGNGLSPLANMTDWVNVVGYITDGGDFMVTNKPPVGKELIKAQRETNTMPQWAGSSWYYLRYIDPHNNKALVAKDKEKYWAPVDIYVGGDHAVRHLIYARFWHKFLYDIGVVSTNEPFHRLEFLGFILAEDGRKMSKRWGNVINPNDIVALVGADTLRIYEMFMGPFENTIAWSKDGLAGARRFLERVNGLSTHIYDAEPELVTRQLHKTIKKVSDDIEGFKFNTAVSTMMIFVNYAEKEGLKKNTYEVFLKLLAPFAPHLTEELWHEIGKSGSIHLEEFPVADIVLIEDDEVTIGVQINGKVRGSVVIALDADKATAIHAAEANAAISVRLSEGMIKKVIYIPGKILNFIIH